MPAPTFGCAGRWRPDRRPLHPGSSGCARRRRRPSLAWPSSSPASRRWWMSGGSERQQPVDIRATPRFAVSMRIGQLAEEVGVSTDTVRFYERSGWLPRASRRDNAYREYGNADVEHLRLLIDLRRLDVPLEDAARIAGWCHSGHCADATAELPRLIGERRAAIARRIPGLKE